MKPAARIQSAIEILELIFEGKRPADALVGDYFKARRYAGSKDRRSITEIVYTILRKKAKLHWLAEQVQIDPTPRSYALIDCALRDDDLETIFVDDQYSPAPLQANESDGVALLKEIDINTAPQSVRLEFPEWLQDDLTSSLGDDFEVVLNALNEEAPLDLRINSLHPNAKDAAALLLEDNLETEAGPYSPVCLRSQKKVKLSGLKSYQDGLVDIQDEGSQLIALLTQAKGCDLVMDFCAGGGGKTLALAAEMENQGMLYALDISSTRLYKMKKRLERAGASNVHLHPIKVENDPWLKGFECRVDRMLIDAPCSGIGAWRRNPESRWKMTPELLADLLGRQKRILQSSAHLVKQGGRLIYATCSLLKRENEDQIAEFLKENDNYSIVPITAVWAERFDTPCPFEGDFMTMRPDLHKSDGFFCAILERNN
jgi:16S rRNA (cytosine967-C5)-methyltransferase